MIFVHRYKYSHLKKRKKYRRLYRQGKVELISHTKLGWTYKELN